MTMELYEENNSICVAVDDNDSLLCILQGDMGAFSLESYVLAFR